MRMSRLLGEPQIRKERKQRLCNSELRFLLHDQLPEPSLLRFIPIGLFPSFLELHNDHSQ